MTPASSQSERKNNACRQTRHTFESLRKIAFVEIIDDGEGDFSCLHLFLVNILHLVKPLRANDTGKDKSVPSLCSLVLDLRSDSVALLQHLLGNMGAEEPSDTSHL